MNSRKSIFISALILSVLFTGCTPKEVKGDRAEFDSYIKALDEDKQSNLMWTEQEQSEFTAYAPDFTEQLGEFTETELDNLIKEREAIRRNSIGSVGGCRNFFPAASDNLWGISLFRRG